MMSIIYGKTQNAKQYIKIHFQTNDIQRSISFSVEVGESRIVKDS